MKRFTNPYNRTDDGVWTKYILLIIIICRWVSSSLAVLLTESENKIENRHNRQNATNIGHKGFWKSQPAVNTCRWFETKDSKWSFSWEKTSIFLNWRRVFYNHKQVYWTRRRAEPDQPRPSEIAQSRFQPPSPSALAHFTTNWSTGRSHSNFLVQK